MKAAVQNLAWISKNIKTETFDEKGNGLLLALTFL